MSIYKASGTSEQQRAALVFSWLALDVCFALQLSALQIVVLCFLK
jgi:hypothetical protein